MNDHFSYPARLGNPLRRIGEASPAIFCGTDNLKGLPAAQQRAAHAAAAQAVAAHGADPCTRQQVAAHEAGHVLVAWTYGQRVRSSRIDPFRRAHAVAWIGVTHTSLPGRPPDMRTTAAEDVSYAFRAAVDAIAGICAEIHAGKAHPASSVDEQFRAAAMCEEIGAVLSLPTRAVLTAAVGLARRALGTNQLQFDVVRAQLAAERRLTGQALAGVLARGVRLDWDALWAATLSDAGNRPALPPGHAALLDRAMDLWSASAGRVGLREIAP